MENDIAMMVVTEQKDAPLIAPIKLSDSKGQCDLMKESFAHFALHPAIINDFENGQSIFNARRFISNWDCAEIYRSVIGRICTKSRQEFDLSPHDVGSGLVYCNEKTGVPQLYAVLIDYDKATKTQIYAYLDYYQDWIHN